MRDILKRQEDETFLLADKSSQNGTCIPHESQHLVYNSVTLLDTQENQTTGDVPKPVEYVTYKRRWYILILFSLVVFTQQGVWNTWGPIAGTAEFALQWTDADIALLTNWGPITYVVSAPFFSWLMDVKGLKTSMLCSCACLLIGVLIRCIPVATGYNLWIMNIAHIFIGLPGPLCTAGPPLISAVWFPAHQRTTSTAFITASTFVGTGGSFLIAPWIVRKISMYDGTDMVPVNNSMFVEENTSTVLSHDNNPTDQISLLMIIEAGWTLLLCAMAFLYFPSKPPTPPSAAADTKREDFVEGACKLLTSFQFWLMALSYGLSTGVYNVYGTQIEIIFNTTVGVAEETVGWIGFWANIASVGGCLLLARFVDHLGGKMKEILLLLSVFGVICCIWIILICLKVISFNMVIALTVFSNSTNALYFELTVEGTYPVSEGITAMIMTWLNNVTGIVFLLIVMIKSLGVMWMNYVQLAGIAVCIPMLLLYKERYNRLTEDIAAE